MIGSGPWVRGARFADGLMFPARPRVLGRACDLYLAADGVTVTHSSARVTLLWQDHDLAHDPAPGRWNTSFHTYFRGAPVGVGLLADADTVDPLRQSLGLRSGPVGRFFCEPRRLPLFARVLPSGGDIQLIDRTAALMGAIARRPSWQQRLADESRVERLCAQLRPTALANGRQGQPLRRRPAEVARALRVCGFVHDIGGRPVSSAEVAGRDLVLAAVASELRRHPDDDISKMPEAEVIRHVNDFYLEVRPWPFSALD